MAITIHRFAPTRLSKFALGLDLVLIAAAVTMAARLELRAAVAWSVPALLVAWAAGAVTRHYAPKADLPIWEELVMTTLLVGSVALVLALGRLFGAAPSALRFLALAWGPLVLVRLAVVVFGRSRMRPSRDVLVVGTGALGRIAGEDLVRAGARCSFVSWPGEPVPEPPRGVYLGDALALPRVLQSDVFDEVYLCGVGAAHASALQKAVEVCETFGVPFALPACSVRLGRAQPVAEQAVADGFLHYVTGGAPPRQRYVKRLLDIGGSAAALLFLAPFLLVVAALVRLTSSGPVFFRQVRVGLHGRKFNMLKFRSMVADAEAQKVALAARNEQSGPVFKMRSDPRVTPLGRILRKYSIDELPQLVNVLRGDMTLVGPRPPVPQEVAQYEPWQRRRLSVPPGLTCLWQVSGRNEIAFQDWMYMDLQYIDHWTVAQDLNLLLKTVPVVVTGRGSH